MALTDFTTTYPMAPPSPLSPTIVPSPLPSTNPQALHDMLLRQVLDTLGRMERALSVPKDSVASLDDRIAKIEQRLQRLEERIGLD